MNEVYKPRIVEHKEYNELANDFQHPFEAIREAIANSYDHLAHNIHITCESVDSEDSAKPVFKLTMEDDGSGMNLEMLHAFFDIGNSIKPEGSESIGYKGHGTKVYLRSRKIEVITATENGERYIATVNQPDLSLKNEKTITINIGELKDDPLQKGTRITILGFFDNQASIFKHEWIKDYILWHTAHGSVRPLFEKGYSKNVRVFLKGVDREGNQEEIPFGHPMPLDAIDAAPAGVPLSEAPKHLRKVFGPKTYSGLTDPSGIKYKAEIIGIIAGEEARYRIPEGVRRGTAKHRFGLWLCKDYIPIDHRPDLIATDQSYIPYHFVLNCDQFSLTANRGSVSNTDRELLERIESIVDEFLEKEVKSSNKFDEWEEAKKTADTHKKTKKQYEKLEKRIKALKKRELLNVAGSIEFVPRNEQETMLVLQSLLTMGVSSLPFIIDDAESQIGIDLLIRIYDSAKQELEYKTYEVEHKLSNFFEHEHGLKQVHGIVCWTDEGYKDGFTQKYMDNEIKFTVGTEKDGIASKALMITGLTPIPIYVLIDIVKSFKKIGAKAFEWESPFHCKKCGKELSIPFKEFISHSNTCSGP